MRNGFFKGHGLGNDYIVVDPAELDFRLTPGSLRALCDRHHGIGADGVLAVAPTRRADFGVRIYNPDGSEAERSGNGLRIFICFLHATGRTRRDRLRIETRAGVVDADVERGRGREVTRVRLGLGVASFAPRRLPCTLAGPELVDRPLRLGTRALNFTGVSVGNPHCVIFARPGRKWTRADLLALGPRLETHRVFPRRTNVQLVSPAGPRSMNVLVWERGAGETAASGTSACAVAAAGVRRGLLKSPVSVRMPGGTLRVTVSGDFELTLEGPVAEVARGRLAHAFTSRLRSARDRRGGSGG